MDAVGGGRITKDRWRDCKREAMQCESASRQGSFFEGALRQRPKGPLGNVFGVNLSVSESAKGGGEFELASNMDWGIQAK